MLNVLDKSGNGMGVGLIYDDYRSVRDFGVRGNGYTDDTAAMNLAFRQGGNLVVDIRDVLISGRLEVPRDNTNILLEGCRIRGNPGRYTGQQLPFLSMFTITGKNCSIRGTGKQNTLLQLTGGSEANLVSFLHTEGGYAGYFSCDGDYINTTAIIDDTFGTAVTALNAFVSNPTGGVSRVTFEEIEARGMMHYGLQVYGDQAQATIKGCDLHDIGNATQVLSTGSGIALTRGCRDIIVSENRIQSLKQHGILVTSAGLPMRNLHFTDNMIASCGGWGFTATEEVQLASVAGIGLIGVTSSGNTIRNCANGMRFGTYNDVGFIGTVSMNDLLQDNTNFGLLLQSNALSQAKLNRVDVDSLITGNGVGLGLGPNIDSSVRWNSSKIGNNTMNLQNGSGLAPTVVNSWTSLA